MATRWIAWLGGTAACIALLASSATPAAAEDNLDVLLSSDGIVFSSAPPQGILDPLQTLVPGGSRESVLWIRNPAATRAIVKVSATRLRIPSASFAEDVSLTTTGSEGSGTRSRTLAQLSECEMLVPSQILEGGATMRLDLRFAMSPDARNASQSQRADLSLLIAMRDADAGDFAESACDDPGVVIGPKPAVPTPGAPSVPARSGSAPGALARTGVDLPVPFIAIGALLLGAGFFLLGARRRREREES